jgi:NADH-quinone oxidoreductase subunit F
MSSQNIVSISDLQQIAKEYNEKLAKYKFQVLVCSGAGCISSNCGDVKDAILDEISKQGLQNDVTVFETGCMGTCAVGPVILILPERIFYTDLTPEIARTVIQSHIVRGEILTQHTFYDNSLQKHVPVIDDIDFFKEQVKIALRNCGAMEYNSLDAYIAREGYLAAATVLTGKSGEEVVEEVKKSGLKGRGGAGFPTGVKWDAGRRAIGEKKFIVCNADEGDPGAFMDRSIIEGDPHSLIEGMIIGGYAIGASMGYVYVRAEYPIAVERLSAAIEEARKRGLLGTKLFGSDFAFDLEIRIGAGASRRAETKASLSFPEGLVRYADHH